MNENTCITIYDQMLRMRAIVPPPVRFNLTSPYPKYTQSQLDMRRKTEILKYSGVMQNTKTNKFTKRELWSKMANRKTTPLSQHVIANSDCASDSIKEYIPTPTSSCDVPGPIIYLINDPAIPLYKYITKERAYGIINQPILSGWITELYNHTFDDGVMHNIYTIYVQPQIDNSYYTFTLQTPVSIYVEGIRTEPFDINVSVTLGVYYSENLVYESTHSFAALNVTPHGVFNAAQYIGMLIISNIYLPTQPTNVYDFKLTFSLPAKVKAVCIYANDTNNCEITGQPTDPPLAQTLTGI